MKTYAHQARSDFVFLSPKQEEILHLLLKFRHLNQHHIQSLLNHKAKSRVYAWLKELTERGFLHRTIHIGVHPESRTYCLDTAAIGFLSAHGVDAYLLKRLYYDKTHSQKYIDHCLFITDVYLSLIAFAINGNITLRYESKTDLYNIQYLILPHPDAYFTILEPTGRKMRYFLDYFDDRIFIYRRVYQYLAYFEKNYWQYKTKKPFPEVIFICPDTPTKKSIRGFIESKINYDAPVFLLTTKKQILEQGMCSEILEKVAIYTHIT